MKIALLYNHLNTSIAPQTTITYLYSFGKFSKHDIYYLDLSVIKSYDFSNFDCLVFYYYGQVYCELQDSLRSAIRNFQGLTVFFAQDEYDNLTQMRQRYADLKVDVLFSACANLKNEDLLYPKSLLPNLKVESVLTGYVDSGMKYFETPIKEKELDVFYRGNNLGIAYGNLGYEKFEIGATFKEISSKYNLKTDIEIESEKQIYGLKYYAMISSAKAVLVTESGSSIACFTLEEQKLRSAVIGHLKKNKSLKDLKVQFSDFFKNEGNIVVNVISPKVFEAITCKTAIIGYEGEYSGVIKPNVHYIPLKKDWSNIEEVITKLKDDNYLQELTERAYNDIILSGKYTYETFIKFVDERLDYYFTSLNKEKGEISKITFTFLKMKFKKYKKYKKFFNISLFFNIVLLIALTMILSFIYV